MFSSPCAVLKPAFEPFFRLFVLQNCHQLYTRDSVALKIRSRIVRNVLWRAIQVKRALSKANKELKQQNELVTTTEAPTHSSSQ